MLGCYLASVNHKTLSMLVRIRTCIDIGFFVDMDNFWILCPLELRECVFFLKSEGLTPIAIYDILKVVNTILDIVKRT